MPISRSFAWGALGAAFLLSAAGTVEGREPPEPVGEVTPQVEHGKYMTVVGDCIACHTTREGIPFTGGRAVPTPFGTLYTPNLTPDEETGIGLYTDEEWLQATKHGVRRDGANLYPALPYPYFSKVRDEDLLAIKAYLFSLEPVRNETPDAELTWPLGFRPLLSGWKLLYFDDEEFEPNPEKSDAWNHGAYLVEGLAHCGACHTPRNFAGAAKEDLQARYGGSELQNWHAPDLGPDPLTGLGNWSQDDIVAYLQTGTNGRQFAAGLMREVVEYSTQWMTDEDVQAIATYLKDLPVEREEVADARTVPVPEPRTDMDPQTLTVSSDTGEQLYRDNCTGCHRWDGGGQVGVFPALAGSPIVQAPNATSLVHVILDGAEQPSTRKRPTIIEMPAYGWKFDDEEVAAVTTYIRNAWGNRAEAVDAGFVGSLRQAIAEAPH